VSDYGDVVASVMDAERRRVPAAVGGHAVPCELVHKPIFKSVGGKGRLVPILMQHLPAAGFRHYVEPFCGGAALFFALAPQGGAILGDLNAELVDLYAALVHDVEAVIHSYDAHVAAHARDARRHYYFMRDLFNDEAVEMGIHERAATVLYLNRAGFNGLYRVNAAGAFNVPMGRDRSGAPKRVDIDVDRLRAAAALLARARLVAGDYTSTVAMAEPFDLVYIDPPYDATFTSYTPVGFDLDDQANLEINARKLAQRGVHVLLSNADTPTVREIYRDAAMWLLHDLEAPRSVAANGQKRGKARELLISSYVTRGAAS
jgi:DNA adenine methylase